MDILWQYNNPPNPSDAAIGPQAYDHHLYYRLVHVSLCVTSSRNLIYFSSFPPVALAYVDDHTVKLLNVFSTCLWQGVADADPESYLQNLCSASDIPSSTFLPCSILRAFLLQIGMIFRGIPWRGILPFGMASGRWPPSSMQRTTF